MKIKTLLAALLIAALLLTPVAMMEESDVAPTVTLEETVSVDVTETDCEPDGEAPAVTDEEDADKEPNSVANEEETPEASGEDAVDAIVEETAEPEIEIVPEEVDEVVAEAEDADLSMLESQNDRYELDFESVEEEYDQDIYDLYMDHDFWDFLVFKYDKNNSGGLSQRELDQIVILDLTEYSLRNNIKELRDISLLTNLKELYASGCTGLTEVVLWNTYLEVIDLRDCTGLERVQLDTNVVDKYKTINLSGCTNLKGINFFASHVENLILSNCTGIIDNYYEIREKTIDNFDLSGCTGIGYINLLDSVIGNMNLCGCTRLSNLSGDNHTTIECIDCKNCTNLGYVSLCNKGLKKLSFNGCNHMVSLNCSNNSLSQLDLNGCTDLYNLDCTQNNLSEININDCQKLISATTIPDYYVKEGVKGYRVDSEFDDGIYYTDYSLYCDSNVRIIPQPPEDKIVVSIDAEHFPDDNFRGVVLSVCDPSGDGKLSVAEIKIRTFLGIGTCEDYDHLPLIPAGAKSLKGIEYFTNLRQLDLTGNQVSSINLKNNEKLTELNCSDNKLSSLDLSNNKKIEWLSCKGNSLTKLDIRKCTLLVECIKRGEKESYGNYTVWLYDNCYIDVDQNVNLIYEDEVVLPVDPPASVVEMPTSASLQEPVTIVKVPSSAKAKAGKKGKVTVSWKKIKKTKKTKALLKQIKGIQVQYSTDPTFTTNVQTKNLGKKKTKVTLKGLQKKTVYYIRVRYIDGAGGVSNWSTTKKVKTKK